MKIRSLITIFCCFAAFALQTAQAAGATCKADWPLWNIFDTHFIQDSGRVLDASTDMQHSSSEGQSYGMFFALVAGDRAKFDLLWQWSINNLAKGDASANIPAWIWGKADDGAWRVIDENSASDASLFFAYTLLEAGRLWREPNYTRQASELLDLVEKLEVADLPELGKMLLPGRNWFFNPADNTWQLNGSYLPVPLLRRLALARPNGPWTEIANNTAILTEATTPFGFAPDWAAYQARASAGSFIVDPKKGPTGSYDAIRNYLWAGMTPPDDPLSARMLKALRGMAAATSAGGGVPPESVDTQTGQTSGQGPFGFSASLIPYFSARNEAVLLEQQFERVQAGLSRSADLSVATGRQPPYYDYVLTLFGNGWLDRLYRFRGDGTLALTWGTGCDATRR